MSSSDREYHRPLTLAQSRVVVGTIEGHADTVLITLWRHFVQLFLLTRDFPVWSQKGQTALDSAKDGNQETVVPLLDRAPVSVCVKLRVGRAGGGVSTTHASAFHLVTNELSTCSELVPSLTHPPSRSLSVIASMRERLRVYQCERI